MSSPFLHGLYYDHVTRREKKPAGSSSSGGEALWDERLGPWIAVRALGPNARRIRLALHAFGD